MCLGTGIAIKPVWIWPYQDQKSTSVAKGLKSIATLA